MTKYTSKIDIFDTAVWSPPMRSANSADAVVTLIEDISADYKSFRDLARALDQCGASLILKPDHHGERDTWILMIRKRSWFAARLMERGCS